MLLQDQTRQNRGNTIAFIVAAVILSILVLIMMLM
jgi:hypothetical protein